MKVFDFECINPDCGTSFEGQYIEKDFRGDHYRLPPECPECYWESKRIYSPPAIAFKGGGFTKEFRG